MTSQTTWNHGTIRITSYGNGWAYAIDEMGPVDANGVSHPLRSVYLQDDDATAWRDEYEAAPDAAEFCLRTLEDHVTPALENC